MTAFRPHPSALSLLLAAGVLLGLQACKSSPPAEPPKAQAPQAPEVDAVPLKAIQEGLRTQEVPAASTLQVWFPAEAAGDESARALLTAPVSGIIASAPAAPGRPLAKGAVLLTLRSPELAELKSRWLSAQARLKRAQADLARDRLRPPHDPERGLLPGRERQHVLQFHFEHRNPSRPARAPMRNPPASRSRRGASRPTRPMAPSSSAPPAPGPCPPGRPSWARGWP